MMQGWWVADLWARSHMLLFAWVVWVIGSITLHELAHGWAAIRQGDRTPIETGHMTWNPLVHMGQFSLLLFFLVGIAFGMMPVNPSRFRSRHGDAIVAAAGPLMNLSLAVIAAVIAAVIMKTMNTGIGTTGENLLMVFRVGVLLNIVLMVFNLLPLPPLDGSRILADFVPSYRGFFLTNNGQIVGLMIFAGVFFLGSEILWGIGGAITDRLIGTIAMILGA